MKQTTRLRSLIEDPKLLIMPAAYDALSARLAQEAGYEAVQCSGLGIATSEGVPDFSILSMREFLDRTRVMVRSVDVPVMGDADTGYGSAVNVWHCTRDYEDIGAAGMNLEDQVFPKRCGRIAGKELVSIEEMQSKIEAAADARRDKDFVINARTDGLSLIGMDEAVKRGNAYLDAGATMAFIQGVTSLDECKELVARINGPVAMNVVEEKEGCATMTFAELEAIGIARVGVSTALILGAIHGMRNALASLKEWGGTRIDPDVFAPFNDLQALGGMPEARALEARYVHRVQG